MGRGWPLLLLLPLLFLQVAKEGEAPFPYMIERAGRFFHGYR